jgi:uncharacterized protein
MPITPTYPGVYVEEIPSGVRTITGVATSITAFIGRALRGPVDDPVTINCFADFERVFGGLWVDSALGYVIRDFFLNGGNQAIVVRLYHEGPENREKAKEAAKAVGQAAMDAVGSVDPLDDKTSKNASDAATAKAGTYPKDTDEKKAAEYVAKLVKDVAKKDTKLGDFQKAVKEGIKAAPIPSPSASKATLILGTTPNELKLEAANEGAWGNNLRARVDHDCPKDLPESYKRFQLQQTDLFNLTVRDMLTGITEQFRNVTVKEGPRKLDVVLKNESRLVSAKYDPKLTTAPEETDSGLTEDDKKIVPFSKEDVQKSKRSVPVLKANEAADGIALTFEDFTGPGKPDDKKGLYALEKADLFNMLCIPPYLSTSADVDQTVVTEAAVYCEKRRSMLLVDPRQNWNEKRTAVSKFNDPNDQVGTRSKNAAIFFPRLKQPNPLHDNQMEEFVPCGAVAGVFARTDTQRGVWKAPAGLEATLVGVPQLTVPLTDADNGDLNQLGINCLRAMPAVGRVVWGSRTLHGDDRLASEWKYIPVRRTALFIEESLYRGTQWVVFEPNDEPLWAQIRLNIGAFMHNLFRQGAFQGKTPRDAYFVKCDKETTTQNDINLGIVNILVGFAPLKPAEFVIIKIQQMAGQIEV